jgi:hypothetical protein
MSSDWGKSGKATMYRAASSQSTGYLGFSTVESTKDTACERRSAKKVNKPLDYSSKGQIPPGIYFLSYHRLDDDKKRHRLGLGDTKAGTNIKVQVGGKEVTRTHIQFHEAYNNLKEYKPKLSEGCIIFNKKNFAKLFPKSFLDPASSPLQPTRHKRKTAAKFKGKGDVLVFVTDITDRKKQEQQIEIFKAVVAGQTKGSGLAEGSFKTDSMELKVLRALWAKGH